MKKFIFTLFFIIPALIPVLAVADINAGRVDEFVYHVYLQYNNGRVSLDNKNQRTYSIIAEGFQAEAGAFTAKVLSGKGEELARFNFTVPARAVPRGSFTVKAPYYANAGRIVFSSQAGELLSVSVAESSFCNEDNVCNVDVGEDWRNCRSDCIQPAIELPAASAGPIPQKESGGFSFWPFVILVVSVIIVYIAGVLIMRRQSNQAVQ